MLSLVGAVGGLLLAIFGLGAGFSWLVPASGQGAPTRPAVDEAVPAARTDVKGIVNGGEPPLLEPLVREQILPKLAERVGSSPLVAPGTGNYGGTWFRASDSIEQALFDLSFRLAGATAVRWSSDGRHVQPALVASWTHGGDFRRWEFTLRPGVRWSDGQPLTTRDVEYTYRHEVLADLTHAPSGWLFRGKLGRLSVLDEQRFCVEFDDPNPLVLERLASDYEGIAQPEHYLRRFHPELGDPQFLDLEMRRRGLTSARQLYAQVRQLGNPAHPRLWPWILLERPVQSPVKAVRNPYYWEVDGAGRQLPYLDQVVIDIRAPQMIALAAAHGQLTFQEQFIGLKDYSYLHSMAAKGLCQVYHWRSSFGSRWSLYPNLNRAADDGDPASRWKVRLLNERRFRQAISLALDRREMIRISNLGFGEPAQISPPEDSPYYHAGLSHAYVEFDPRRAGQLLDELCLTNRDTDGFRTFPDRSRMVWFVDWSELAGSPPATLVQDLERVGLRVVLRQRSNSLFELERAGHGQDFIGAGSYPNADPAVFPMAYLPTSPNCYFAYHYGLWFAAGGLWSAKPPELGQAPPAGSSIRRALELYDALIQTPDPSARQAIFSQIAQIASDELWTIAVLPQPPDVVVASPRLRNVPAVAMAGFWQGTPANAGATAFWLEGAETDPALANWYRSKWSQPRTDVYATGDIDHSSPWAVATSLGGLVMVFLAAWKSRYIARRLAVLVPTLALVSIAVFTIISWPPGSFVESKKMQLAAAGRDFAVTEIRLLEEEFHLKEPGWKRYARWSGLYWFCTFSHADRGLLQGELGRSMETGRPIAEMLGERIVITVLLAFSTLLFTWALAVPLGMISAVKANSGWDHVIAFAGFLAISVPGFLLALLLLFAGARLFGTVSIGLFSPEFAARPGWSAAKVLDMLRNIWLPLTVLALGGTAGMIRLLRVNLMEEIRRPYVQAARARGMRPVRLLLKYPLRVALNPFASGVGSIFPYLVSGEVIVATLLSLPTIGPVLLSALLSQDTLLAASIIMLLTLLATVGTLVSDLLLVWLDPRIRLGARN